MALASSLVDLGFALSGRQLARDHRWLMAQALLAQFPWLAGEPLASLHPVRLVPGSGTPALLSARSRLLLRLPRARVDEMSLLSGRSLKVGDDEIVFGAAQVRELLPHTTLYSHFVCAGEDGEVAFMDAVGTQLDALGVRCHRVCGRELRVRGPAGPLRGYSLMLHGLAARDSLLALEQGLGGERLMGCGVFVPHKSAAAVGD